MVPLQDAGVKYYGQIIGFVVAETLEQARNAARLVKVRYHSDTPTLTWEAGMNLAYFPGVLGRKANVWSRLTSGVPSIDAALAMGAIKSEGVYITPFEHHNPMEPHAAAKPGKTREDDWWIGRGMATALNEATRPESSARIRFQVDGTVAVSVATHELGTGMYTILAMIAAERLGWPVEKMRPELGDSTLPAAPGSFAAQSTGSVRTRSG